MSKQKDHPMTEENLLEFLRIMLIDSEGGGRCKDDKAPPGFVTWLPLRMDPDDYYIRECPDHVSTKDDDPFLLESDQHGAAYAISMEALLRLRHWWKDCSVHYGKDRTVGEAISSMREDIDHVIGYLQGIKDGLDEAGQGYEQAAKSLELREETARRDLKHIEAQRPKLLHKLKLARTLTASQMDLLAGQVHKIDTSDTTQDREE